MALEVTPDATQPRLSMLVLTKYDRNGASSRYRSLQYLDYFEQAGIRCTVAPLFSTRYLEFKYARGRAAISEVIRAFVHRLRALTKARRYDVVFVQAELIPYFPAVLERLLVFLGCNYIVDYDDALFHQYDMHRSPLIRKALTRKIATVMRKASAVVVGNAYLAGYAHRAGASNVHLLPTVIDLHRYSTMPSRRQDEVFTIGWIGSPSTAKYLHVIHPALAEMCADGRSRVRLIGSGPVDLPGVDVEVVAWDEATEVDEMRTFDVGVMPLTDDPWSRGKCGFKLIQYMACGLPTVASPVGVNSEIVEQGVNGFIAPDLDAWVLALSRLRDDVLLRRRLGETGRSIVEQRYCVQVTAPQWVRIVESLV